MHGDDAPRPPRPLQRERADNREPARDGGPDEAAFYIKGALADLSLLARRHHLDMLRYLLDMAHLEAEDIVRGRGQRKS